MLKALAWFHMLKLFSKILHISNSNGQRVTVESKLCVIWAKKFRRQKKMKLTLATDVADNDPKVDGLLPAQLLKVPPLLDPDGAVGLHRDPRVLVSDLEGLALRLLLQLEHDLAGRVAVGLGKLGPFGRTDGSGHATLHSSMAVLA